MALTDDKTVPGYAETGSGRTACRQAEQTLRETEEHYQTLLAITGTGVVTVAAGDGTVFDASQVYVELTGHRTLDEIRGRTVVEWTAPYDRERNAAAVQECFASGRIRNLVIDYQHADGKIVPIEINAEVLTTDRGRVVQALCRDITDRRRAEEQIRAADELRRTVLATAADGIAVCHVCAEFPFVRFSLWNAAMERLTGYSMAEINELGWYQSMYPDPEMSRRAAERMTRMRAGEHLRDEEWTITRRDGTVRVLAITTSLLASGAGEVLALMRDISDRKRMEEQLRESAEQLGLIIDNAAEGIAVADVQTQTIVFANAMIGRMLGYAPEEIIGKRVADIHPAESLPAVQDAMARQHSGKEVLAIALPCLRRDGSVFYADIRGANVQLRGRNCLIGLFTDTTDRKYAEEMVLESIRREATVGRIAAAVAHEVNNPLGAIKFWLRVFQQKTADNPELRESVRLVETQVDRISSAVRDMLGFARHRAGHADTIPAGEIVQNIAGLYQGLLEAQGIALTVTITDNLPGVTGQIDDLQETLINLLENAKHILGNGNKVWIRATATGSELTIIVANDGPALGDNPERIFARFYTTRRDRGGNGLGLYQARLLCQRHGGALTAADLPEGGVAFRITLPLLANRNLVALQAAS